MFGNNLPFDTAHHYIFLKFNYSAQALGSFYLNRGYYEVYVVKVTLLSQSRSLIYKQHYLKMYDMEVQ
jgi:hypothetical protein